MLIKLYKVFVVGTECNAGFSLQKSIETRYHGSFDIEFRKGLPCSGGMAADDIIL